MRLVLFVLGILLILLASLARAVGFDHDASWGAGRILLLFGGLALSGAAALVHLYKTGRITPGARRVIAAVLHKVCGWLAWARRAVWMSEVFTAVLLLGVAAYAVWYASFGLFPRFTRVVNPYVDLGEAFLRGQVALLAQPDPQLVALANPYDPAQRENVPFLWDLSYYKGRYYAYWGPVPALLYAAVEALTHAPPPDQMGVLVFYVGLAVVLGLLLFHARQRFFPRAPALSIPLFLLAALLNLPMMHILQRGQVYETSVIAGQFFLFLGLLAWLCSLDGQRLGWLLLAGLSWGLAIATRYNLALSSAVLVAFTLYRLVRVRGWSRASLRPAAALLSPLALCGMALALYNHARFGNPLETGLVYQLTIPVYQNRHFSPAYVLSNLYIYLSYPLAARPAFPFFPSLPIDFSRLPGWAAPPQGKLFDEVFFGMGPSLPVLWLSVGIGGVIGLSIARQRWHAWRFYRRPAQIRPDQTGLLKEGHSPSRLIPQPGFTGLDRSSPAYQTPGLLIAILALAGLLQFVFLLFYYFAANRFIIDFLPLVLLALALLAWKADENLTRTGWARAVFWLAAALLALATVFIAVLAGFDIVPQSFRLYNPDLYQAIAARADRAFTVLLSMPDSPGVLGAGIRLILRLIK